MDIIQIILGCISALILTIIVSIGYGAWFIIMSKPFTKIHHIYGTVFYGIIHIAYFFTPRMFNWLVIDIVVYYTIAWMLAKIVLFFKRPMITTVACH